MSPQKWIKMAAFYQVRTPTSLLVDPLCCNEEDLFPFWEEDVEGQYSTDLLQQAAVEQAPGQAQWDWDEDGGAEESVELAALLSKEAVLSPGYLDADPCLSKVRLDAARWLLKACARHGFTAQTALLAVDYLDRFLSSTRCGGAVIAELQQQQPWMAQLSAVACLSLAAKMEETHVPLLLDLQVEEARYVFEARTVQRMELLVLSTLGWKMGSPTPLSYIDHFLRRRSAAADRTGPLFSSPSHTITNNNTVNKNDTQQQQQQQHLHCNFQAACHSLLLTLVADSRWVRFLPSVLAAATMLHALGQLLNDHHYSASSTIDIEHKVMNFLNVTKDQVQACCEFILDATVNGGDGRAAGNKCKRPQISLQSWLPPSPRGVVDASFSCDSYNNSLPASASTSVSSSPETLPPRAFKRLHSMVTVGAEEEQSCPRPLLDGVFV